jgi:hypothetical protein
MANNKTTTLESYVVQLIFQNVSTPPGADSIGDDGLKGSTTAGSLYLTLHTSDPGEAGTQTTNEVATSPGAYVNYARVAVARDNTEWPESPAGKVSNGNVITFPTAGAASGGNVTHFGIGTSASGAGNLLYYGPLTAPLAISNGVVPQFAAGTLTVEEL